MKRALEERIVGEIRERGPMAFEQFVEQALYHPELGFYATTGRAGGRRGDFITSVEAGPLFAAVIADWLDGIWRDLGSPAEFLVSEAGAGIGTLFRGINKAAPACFEALTYTLVERSASMREVHAGLPSDQWRSAASLPEQHQHVVLANELLDNLAFGIAERVDGGWARVHVAVDHGRLVLVVGEAEAMLGWFTDLAPDAPTGTRVPLAINAADWVASARSNADQVLVFDYAAMTDELGERSQAGWLRTYAGHQRGSDPLQTVGSLDITYDVPIDQLPPANVRTQAEWLTEQGMDKRVDEARAVWAERASIGDLAAVMARSAINEAEALTDPSGLGGFQVLTWPETDGAHSHSLTSVHRIDLR